MKNFPSRQSGISKMVVLFALAVVIVAVYFSVGGNHVNVHVGVAGNELADRMSIMAIESRDIDFTLYREELDIETILAMRAG